MRKRLDHGGGYSPAPGFPVQLLRSIRSLSLSRSINPLPASISGVMAAGIEPAWAELMPPPVHRLHLHPALGAIPSLAMFCRLSGCHAAGATRVADFWANPINFYAKVVRLKFGVSFRR